MEIRGGYIEEKEAFFIFRDGSNVKSDQVRRTLRKILHRLNLDPKLYDTHSFRIGRALDLLYKFQFSIARIRHIGRWKSNVVFKYLRNL